MRNIGNLGAVAAAICLLAQPLTAHAQGTSGEAARGAERRGHAAAPIGAAGLLSADQRVRFREYAVRRHRATPYSFREPVTVGTCCRLELYEIPREADSRSSTSPIRRSLCQKQRSARATAAGHGMARGLCVVGMVWKRRLRGLRIFFRSSILWMLVAISPKSSGPLGDGGVSLIPYIPSP
jgi:hypothetical protein